MTRETVAFLLSKKKKRNYNSFARCAFKKKRSFDSSDDTKRPAHASCLLLLILRVLLSLG